MTKRPFNDHLLKHYFESNSNKKRIPLQQISILE